MYRNLFLLPDYLLDAKLRKYIIKNHIHSNYKLPEYLIKGIMQKGKKAKAEQIFFLVIKKLKYISNFFMFLNLAVETLSNPIELSPARFGKKIKMIPRISDNFRQVKRGLYLVTTQVRARKFINKPVITKLIRELISNVYFCQDSFRQIQD